MSERVATREVAAATNELLASTYFAARKVARLMQGFPQIPPGQDFPKDLKKQRTTMLDNAASRRFDSVFKKLSIGVTVDACEGKKEIAKDGEIVDILQGRHGNPTGRQYSIIMDPIDGTRFACTRQEGAITVVAFSSEGGLVPTPLLSDFIPTDSEDEVGYMFKLFAPAEMNGVISLHEDPSYNIAKMIEAYGKDGVRIVMMNRPANADIRSAAEAQGVEVLPIEVGDLLPGLAAVTGTVVDGKKIVVYGRGGDQEGRITAAAAKAVNGFAQGQIWIPREDNHDVSIEDLPIFDRDELVPGDRLHTGVVLTAITDDSTYFNLSGFDSGAELRRQASALAILDESSAQLLKNQESTVSDIRVVS